MKHLGTYLAHYSAVIAGLAAFVASHAALFSAIPGATPYVAGTAGVSAAVVAALHALGVDPPKDTGSAAKLALWVVPLVALLGSANLTACSTVESTLTSPKSAPYVQAAVVVAVSTAESKGISASTINTIAHQALIADQGAGATLAAVSSVVQAQVAKLRLTAADQAAADIVLAALSASIQTQLQANPTLAQAQTAAAVVINDVIAATGG